MLILNSPKINLWQKLTISMLVFLFIFSTPGLSLAAEETATADLSAEDSAPATDDSAPVSEEPPLNQDEQNISELTEDQAVDEETNLGQMSLLDEEDDPYYSDARKPIKSNLHLDNDMSSGALVYSYPIIVPPGRNGLQPDLKLVYNSQSKENANWLGFGWLINIPYIERINKEGIEDLYSENYFTSSLSGELEDVDLSDGTHGTYGSKVDNGEFLDYEYNTNNYWIVTDKKGAVYKFGATASARQDDANDTNKVFKWMLEEVRDTNNNYIKYEYYKDTGQIYPSKIKYTGYDTTDGIFEVEFLRESRTDDLKLYNTGFEVQTGYRIYEIQAKVNSTWVRKYELDYTTGDNGTRSMLETITETGQDEQSNTITLPDNTFIYQTKTAGWTEDTNYNIPEVFTGIWYDKSYDKGLKIAEINGDGLPDLVVSICENNCTEINQAVYINNGDGTGWTEDTNYTIPVYFMGYPSAGVYNDNGVSLIDINGDGLDDIIFGRYSVEAVYINDGDGTGWTEDTGWDWPSGVYFGSSDRGSRLADVNGDGLPDIVRGDGAVTQTKKVYLNNGEGWVEDTNYELPIYFIDVYYRDTGARLSDINGDGLADIVYGAPDAQDRKIYINNGDGTWSEDNNWSVPVRFVYIDGYYYGSYDWGVRLIDVNNDGLPDIMNSFYNTEANEVYINNGESWELDESYSIPEYFTQRGTNIIDYGVRLSDINSDGLVDIIRSTRNEQNQYEKHVYIANDSNADLLFNITSDKGAEMDITYKGTPEYIDASDDLLNPKLPMVLQTVAQITYNDGLDNESTESYEYAGGEYYFADYLNRKLAGFSQVIKTDGLGNVTKTFYHQANDTDSDHGEYSDDVSKIGKAYRTEIYDDSDNLYAKIINKWENYDLGDDRDFVKLTQTISSAYDGDNDHKDKAETYTYDNTNGNLTEKVSWGEVTGSDSGTFTDTGSDDFTTDIDYADSATYESGYPKQETMTDHSSNKVKETKYYYDNENFGTVDEGNLTKQEMWKDTTNYIDIEKTYNSYGLVTQEKDPRDKTTDYDYEQYNLYPDEVTNAEDQVSEYVYDYSSGKVSQMTDPNDRVFQTVYDALDRVKQEKQPDLTTPANLIVKSEYTYTDNTVPSKVQQTNYLDASIDFDIYIYLDGFGRKIQERKEAEDSNTFSVKDFIYNEIGLIEKESLPYFSTGSARTTATSDTDLYTTYTYDPLQRVVSATNAVGTTTNTYDDWMLTITDAESNTKDLYKDAYDNLVQVDEHNGANTYTTEYEWNGLGNLLKITDSHDNERNFTYDGLGRRLTAEDLHDPSDSYFGDWSYTYDAAGNLTSRTDPKSQTVNWTYDDINRVLTEDYTGEQGTEITYVYDTGTDGIGRLYTATTPDAVTTYIYNALGGIKSENKNIDSENYLTEFEYDRQGNQTSITYPSGDEIQYIYNTAGLLEKIQSKFNGAQYFEDIVSDYEYSPLEQITYQENANGIKTYNDYDEENLYRLKEKITASPDEGDYGEGIFEMSMLTNSSYENTSSNDFSLALEATPDEKVQHDFLGREVDYNNYPKDETVYLKSEKIDKPQAIPKEAIRAFDKASKIPNPKTELKSYLPQEAIDYYQKEQPLTQESLLLSGEPPVASTTLESEDAWKSGNIVYNEGFEDDFDYWGWQNNLDATHTEDCTVSYSGDCSEKVTINTSGQAWQVQLYQILETKEDVNYKLRFKAKASTATTFSFEITQHHDPFNNLGLWKGDKDIGTDWSTYEYSFTALADDDLAKVTFELGANSADYWFDDIELIPDSLNTLENISFENNLDNWGFYDYNSSSSENRNCNDGADGDCSNMISNSQEGEYWQVSLNQPVISVTADTTYLLTFYATSSFDNRLARVALTQNYSPWSEITSIVDFHTDLTNGFTKYQIELTPTSTDSNARLIFYLGDESGWIELDDIKFWEEQPTKLSDTTPEFSAIYNDPDTGDYADYYQIQVIPYDGDWNDPLWDSGKTAFTTSVLEGDRSEEISYGGDDLLLNGMKYNWRIKVWDDEDNEGDWTNGQDYFVMQGKRIQDLVYIYDNVGNITQIIDESETNTKKKAVYSYDDLYRLTSATITDSATEDDYTRTYTYDSLGNITDFPENGEYEYDGNTGTSYANPHAVTGLPDLNLDITYDNNGNVTAEIVQPYQWNFFEATWDYNNRMIGSGGFSTATTYAYDHTGQRILMDIGDQYFGTTTIYANKYYNVRTDKETEATTETMHAYDNKGNLIATVENDGQNFTLYYDHTDHLGGTGLMTDQDGEVEQVLDYYPFGGIRFNQQSDPENGSFDEQRKFTGHEYDADSSLTYFGARYYSGDAGKFLSEDLLFLLAGDKQFENVAGYNLIYYLSEPQNLNSYSYVTNNPLKYVDPLGLDKYYNTKGEIVKDTGSGDKSYYEQDDINMLNANASYMEQNKLNFSKFYEKVKTGGDWDYKQQEREFFFNGTLYGSEDFGNLNYGYCGTAGGFSKGLLKDMGGLVSVLSNSFETESQYPITTNFDQPNDTKNISNGINTYMSTHNNLSTQYAKDQQRAYYTTAQPILTRAVGLGILLIKSIPFFINKSIW